MKRTLAFLCFGLVIASTTNALASDPVGIVTSPRSVQWIPDKATATEFVIHGTFELNKGGTPPAYTFSTPPTCGYLHFKCPAGSESLCRMQWGEIEGVIGSGHCRGFGSMSKAPAVTIHTEGTPLGTPDTYDLGIGTQDIYGLGECSLQISMTCGSTTTDAGPTDSSVTDTGTATDSGTAVDSGTPATDSGGDKPDTATVADTGTPPAPAPTQDSSGCTYGAAPVSIGFGALALAAIGLLGRRRRR